MIDIRKATTKDLHLLASLSTESFIPAHGHSAPKDDISSYIEANFSIENFKKEMLKNWEEIPEVFLSSSESRLGIKEITSYIAKLNVDIKNNN